MTESGTAKPVYRRIQLKLSGEALAGPDKFGLDTESLTRIAGEIREVHELGVQIGVTVGGGNLLRGSTFAGKSHIPEASAHHMGMLATVMNALALQETLESLGVHTRVMSALSIGLVCEPYVRRHCLDHMAEGRVVVLGGGTGRPFVTTDTAAALAAVELDADAVIKATQVDGVYSDDPKTNPQAEFYPRLDYDRVINERLRVMDLSAVDMCQRHNMRIVVFDLHKPGNMRRVVLGETVGTVVSAVGK